jgi:hypothetical protein
MNVRTWRVALLATAVLMISAGLLQAQPVMIPASEAVGPPPTVDGTGLAGAMYFDPNDPTRTYSNIAGCQNYIAGEEAYATFTATSLAWLGGDLTPVNQFLSSLYQPDGNSLTPAVQDPMRSSIFDMKGYIKITDADLNATFGLYSDDGSVVLIGQDSIQAVINDGTHGGQAATAQVVFEAPGLYPIEIIYFNQDYQNGTGGAIFLAYTSVGTGGIIPVNRLYPSIPAE